MSERFGFQENRARALDTLAQKRTRPFVIVHGEGSDLSNYTALEGKAKRKTISQKLALALVDVADKKGKPERAKSYWNTFYCQNKLIESKGKLYTKYCKNRFCTVCCAIRKATIINQYLPSIESWENCHFLTLTIKSIPAKELPRYVKGMLKLFKTIIDKHSKRYKRGKGILLQGLKAFECNFNPDVRTYNPHFHILVRTREIGEIILSEWLARIPRKHAQRWAQKLTPITNKEQGLIEIVKYGSKIFTERDLNKKAARKTTPYVYVSALDNILTAMTGHRIFDRFGFSLPAHLRKSKKTKSVILKNFGQWIFNSHISDWINFETGEILSGYQLSRELQHILKNNIDLVSG